MKTVLFLIALITFGNAYSQDKDTMEKRARAMVEVINSGDQAKYKKYIEENYTLELINKKMNAKIAGPEGEQTTTATADADALSAKVNMFDRFHQDLGTGKVSSIKREGDKIIMEVDGLHVTMSFTLTYVNESPYLIKGFGVEANGR